MIEVGRQVTVTCEHDKDYRIMPIKYRSKRLDGHWQEHRIISVSEVSYRIYLGDESICYECKEEDGQSLTECVLRFNIETASWDVFEAVSHAAGSKGEKVSA